MIYIYTIFKNFKILTNYSFEKVWQGNYWKYLLRLEKLFL